MGAEQDEEPEFDQEQKLVDKFVAFKDDHEDEFLADEDIKPERRLHARPDINAFLLLDKLFPGDRDMVSAAEHDEIFLDVEPWELMKVASEEDLLDLIRCGVFYDSDHDSLAMFV